MEESYILSAANLMQTIASYLCMERLATLRHEDLPVQIDNYIQEHSSEDLDAKDICAHFQIGKTRLYEIAKESYGMGIAEVIRLRRIEKAKSLLLHSPEFSLSEVASLCGFHDYNYLITVFRKITGTSPRQFGRAGTADGSELIGGMIYQKPESGISERSTQRWPGLQMRQSPPRLPGQYSSGSAHPPHTSAPIP